MEISIETINLTKIFKVRKSGALFKRSFLRRKVVQSITAVDSVNLKIEKGEIFGLLGPNGAGKTTLIQMLCTILTPTGGTTLINGFDIKKDDFEVRKQIGAMIGSGQKGLYQRLTGRDNLEFYATIYGLPRANRKIRIRQVLDFFDIGERVDDQVQKFSTGMQRQLALCKVLLPDPPILLLDEPTAGLDVKTSRKIMQLLRRINQEQEKTILLTTHYLHEADKLCDRVAIINKGKIMSCASPRIVKESVMGSDSFEISFTYLASNIFEALSKTSGLIKWERVTNDTILRYCTLRCHIVRAESTLPAIIETILKNGGKIRNLVRQEHSLEDAYMSIIESQEETA